MATLHRTPSCQVLVLFLWSAFSTVSSDCPMPAHHPPNGRIIYENFGDSNLTMVQENYILRVRCNNGYERVGPQILLCQKDGWTDKLPQCVFFDCGEAPRINNGNYLSDKRAVGSVVQYECKSGFEFFDPNSTTLTCALNHTYAQWLGELPVCVERRNCPDPGKPAYGSRVGSCCFTGSITSFYCKSGYELVGSRRIKCLHGGNWSHERPRCKPHAGHCPEPPPIANGIIKRIGKGDYTELYREVEVICDPGFLYFGLTELIMCMDNFQWETEFGECVETFCDCPEVPSNGSILELMSTNSTQFPHKFELTYLCKEGFRLVGDVYRSCDKGNWTGPEPRCEPIKCYNPGLPEYGNRNGDNFNVGQKVVFSCFKGFNLIGSVERYCMPNGQWTGDLTRCNLQSNYCPDPGIPINGQKIGNSYKRGDSVRFRCHPGFTLIGNEVRVCQDDRTWSETEVKCIGAMDFDNTADVSAVLQLAVNKKAEEQAEEVSKYWSRLASLKVTASRGSARILDINYPGRLILYFVFDVSGSVKAHNFRTSIEFAKALVKKVNVSENGARAGALTFSSTAEVEFNAVQYSTTQDVLDALDKIEYKKGGTATSSALRLVLEEAIPLTREHLGRSGLKSVIFMLTDGRANTGGDPEVQAKKLQAAGVEIYCIGITGDIVKNTLYKIASKPYEEHVFVLSHYNALEWLIQEITTGTIDYSVCGLGRLKASQTGQSRVIDGHKVIDPWPWMAALYITEKKVENAVLKCGGSIIGKKWILTAAHCLFYKKSKNLRQTSHVVIKLGLTNVENNTNLQIFEPVKFFPHDNYNPENLDYDVAIIELDRFIHYNAYVRPICLPSEKLDNDSPLYKPKEIAIAAGWGYDKVREEDDISSAPPLKDLKELQLPLQSRERCLQGLINQGGARDSFTNRMICAGTGKGGADTCQGDSGGPLMQSQYREQVNVFWTQIGIVSWGKGCALPNSYGYYSKVQTFTKWINEVMSTDTGEIDNNEAD